MEERKVLPPVKIKQLGWPSFWGPDALEEQLALIHAPAFERGFRQRPQADEDLIFGSFEEHKIYEYGIDWRLLSDPKSKLFNQESAFYVNPDWPRYIGCDIAGKKRRGTVIFTLAVSPEGVRHILDIQLGAWSGPEFVRHLQLVDDTIELKPKIIFVENNALQEQLMDWIKEVNAPCWNKVRGFRTGANKMDPEIGLPGIDIQYSIGRWKMGIPHPKGRPSMPNKKDPTLCMCGLCIFRSDASTFTRNDLGETPDSIAAQFIAKEASRQGERYTSTSADVVKVSSQEIQDFLSIKRSPVSSLRLPVTLDGKKFLGQRVNKGDFGRTSGSNNFPHTDGFTVHAQGTCVLCDRFSNLQGRIPAEL